MKNRLHLLWLTLALALFSGCGIFVASHHDPLDFKPIHAASEEGNLPAVEALIKNDPRLVNAKDWDDLTPLHLAAFHGHREVAEFLLLHGADVNAKTKAWVTPLHFAAQIGNREVVELLLAQHAKINATDSKGLTPIARANWRHPEMAAFLQQQGGR